MNVKVLHEFAEAGDSASSKAIAEVETRERGQASE